MKMKLMWGALMAIAFASCTQEDVLNNGAGHNTLRASMEETGIKSRVGFTDQKAEFFWTKGDKIGVTTTSSQTFQGMTLEGEGGQATGTFSGTFNGTVSGYAVYPYGAQGRHSVAENTLTYTLPATYEYETLDTEYAKSDGNSHNAPMWGSISNGSVAFKHLGGAIAFSVGNLPENTSDMQFVLTATNQISGSFNATLTESEPKIVAYESNVADADKKVTITFSTAAGQTSGYFYVPVPTGSLGNLSLVILNGQTEVATGAWDNITIKRKDIKRATIGSQSIIGGNGEIKQVTSVSAVNDALTTTEDNLTVQVSGEVNGTENEIEIPTTLETATTTFSFASVADGAKITIKDADGGSYDGKIIIEIPEGETLPEIVTNIPNGEVYIKQGTVTTLVTSAADNTTIIGANATVGTLTVAKGNVRIENGGQVTTINRASENTATVYVIYESATAPEITKGEGVVLMSAAEWDLITAFKNGGTQTITLTENVELTQPLTLNDANANITLNLGTYSLTNNTEYDYDNCGKTECYVFDVKAGTLNISGTTGSVNANGGSDYDMAVFANGNGQVNISGGKFTNTGKGNDGSDLIYVRDNAAVTISGGEFEAGNRSKDVGNQYVALNKRDADRDKASITVTGGKFHKFNPANNLSEDALTNFTANNTMVAVSGTEGAEVYEVIDLTDGYTLTSDIEIATPIVIDTTGEITLNLGTYSLTNNTEYDYDNCGKTECYVFDVKAGTLNISGTTGSVNANGGSDYDMAVFANGTGQINISGGKFTNTGKGNDGSDLIYVRDNAAVTISGGEFEAGNRSKDVGNQYVALNKRDADRDKASITVTGGKFHKFNPANNLSEDALTNFTASNTMVAVSGTEGAEVYEVIDLTDGYTLTSDIEIATPIVIDTTGEITLNLGTYSLTNNTAYDYDNCGKTECYVFDVKAGTLNISGTTGSVNANGGSNYDMAVFANGTGQVNISGGKFTNTGKENDGSDLIYVRDNAAVTISGGEFKAGNISQDVGNQYVALNKRDADRDKASITVTGGKFYEFDPANNKSENPAISFVAERYTSQAETIDGATWYSVIESSNSLE